MVPLPAETATHPETDQSTSWSASLWRAGPRAHHPAEMADSIEWRLAREAEPQHGIFDRRTARRLGLSDDQIDRRVASGLFIEVQPRVYRFPGTPMTRWARRRAATLGTDRTIAVSHGDAADVHGLERAAGDDVEVTVVGKGLVDRWGVTVHRTAELPDVDITVMESVPVTTGERTVIDVCRQFALVERLALLDDALCANAAACERLHERACALCNGRAAVKAVANATAADARDRFRSWLERHTSAKLGRSGLPAPAWNVPIRRNGRLLGIIDAFWEAAPLGVELDGLRFHDPPTRRGHDKQRDRDLYVEAGIPILRYDYRDVVQQWERMVAQLHRALTRAGVV